MSASPGEIAVAPRFELLNAQDHGALRMQFPRVTRLHFVQIIGSEFSAAAACCPVLLTKDATTGDFYAGAMFGFKPDECLLPTAGDRGGFEPLNLQREGFFTTGEQIAIDRGHPRFAAAGEALFDESQPSAHLRQMQRVLGQLQTGIEKTQAFIRTLRELNLIEAIEVSMNFDDGERLTLQGLYTVSMDSLHALGDAQAIKLFRQGDLQRIYAMNGSLSQIAVLADKRNRLLTRSA
jgi:SapC protein